MTKPNGNCAGCGAPLPPSKGGRRRKWCSENCRRKTMYTKPCEDCGAPMGGHGRLEGRRCAPCAQKRSAQAAKDRSFELRVMVEAMWADGLTMREIGELMGWSKRSAAVRVSNLRSRGYDLPYRRTPEQIARMTAGADERLAAARAKYRQMREAA